MLEDAVVPSQATGRRLLFPVSPQVGETLLGFVTRCLARNHLGSPVQFMRKVGVDLSVKGDLLFRLEAQLPDIQTALGLMDQDLARLWGTSSIGPERSRLLGGVKLRPSLIDQSRRRVPPSIQSDQPDKAIWMVRHITFCPTSWEELVHICPNKWCGKTLTWPLAQGLHVCRHCNAPLSAWKPRKVPIRDRPVLAWVASLFSEDEAELQRALLKVPPMFEVGTATDVYELVLGLGRVNVLSRLAAGDDSGWSYRDLCWGARFLLDYPRSRWDALQSAALGERARLYGLLARVARDTPAPIVRQQINRILKDEGPDVGIIQSVRQPPPGTLTTTGAAALLRVPRGDVKRLFERGDLEAIRASGSERRHCLFREHDVRRIREELNARMNWRLFSIDTGLPARAIEQLLALGQLIPLDLPVARTLYSDRQLELETAERFIDRLKNLPEPGRSGEWVSLEHAFRGVGGREKPWAPILLDGLIGRCPGGLARDFRDGAHQYFVHGTIARALVMGGPDASAWYRFDSAEYGDLRRDELSPGETIEHLNCSAVDLAWLMEKRCLLPLVGAERRRFRRADVESLAASWMTAREAAARLGVEARHLWRVVERHNLTCRMGHGFYLREELEEVVRVERNGLAVFGSLAGERAGKRFQ